MSSNHLTAPEYLRHLASRLPPEAARQLREVAAEFDMTAEVRDRLAELLDDIARTIKGDPGPETVWGFDDLPELVADLKEKAEVAEAVRH